MIINFILARDEAYWREKLATVISERDAVIVQRDKLHERNDELEKENFDYLEELIRNANKIRGILDK